MNYFIVVLCHVPRGYLRNIRMVPVKTVENNGMCEFMNTHVLRNFVWSISVLKIYFYCLCWVGVSFYDEIQAYAPIISDSNKVKLLSLC